MIIMAFCFLVLLFIKSNRVFTPDFTFPDFWGLLFSKLCFQVINNMGKFNGSMIILVLYQLIR